MRKNQVKFIVILLLTMSMFILFSPITYASVPKASNNLSNIFTDKLFLQNVAVAIISAILAFLSGYVLANISKKSSTSKKLSYSLDIESKLVDVKNNIQDRVTILYEGEKITNLYNVQFDIENTGNSVVKSQEIRFEFTEGVRILDFDFDPMPQPEMQVEKITNSDLKPFERKCRIGHMEKEQTLGIRFILTSNSNVNLTPHAYNPDGDVDFVSRSTTKTLNEAEKITRFISLFILYLVIPPVFIVFSPILAGLVRFVILLFLFMLIVPFAEVIAEVITTYSNDKNKETQSLDFSGFSVDGDLTIGDITQGIKK